ncbi:MAG: hypothetical protein AAGD13_22205 [Pseudomonadota bacterium]
MSDIKKDDDPTIIPEADLDNVDGGMKIPNLFSGEDKVIDSFAKIDNRAISVDARFGKDVLSKGFNTGKQLD